LGRQTYMLCNNLLPRAPANPLILKSRLSQPPDQTENYQQSDQDANRRRLVREDPLLNPDERRIGVGQVQQPGVAMADDPILLIDLQHLVLGQFLFGQRPVGVKILGHGIKFQFAAQKHFTRVVG
jgi:hypothetical protein